MTGIIKKTGFKIGIYLGFLLILFISYIYFQNLQLITNVWAGVFTLAITVFFGIISIGYTKKKLNGFITFKEAFSAYFFAILIGSIISCLYLILLYNFVLPPETKEIIRQTMIDFNIKLMKQDPSATQKKIEEALKSYKTFNPFNPVEVITTSTKYLLRDSLIGFLVALIFRNKRIQ
ncbi:DUF4199 domain-containing protein [Flavobacterium chungangense]|uniref:DUF4199 domain-containing protein n=1 Tax=Flavobacterium chungangense TaxID=554283 RepID=A0A6V6Z1A3_9FLAO|nr:DUF4199 domain-containing protein [Flavobacterium chungangense]CAD0005558.1 hypothetical protein FLACHUCJ7_02422 [Flavobacterium chungangense]